MEKRCQIGQYKSRFDVNASMFLNPSGTVCQSAEARSLPALEDILDPDIPTVASDAPLSEAIALMNQMQDRNPHWEGGRVWVVQAGQLVGELSRWDLLAWGAMTADPQIVPVAALMSRCPVAIEVIELGDAVRIVEILQIQAATAKNPCQLDLPTLLQPLPVVDDRRRLLGIVTPDRLWQILQPEDLLKLRQVVEVMDVEPIRVPPNLTVNDVARRMSEHRRTCVLVVPLPSPAYEGTDPDNTGTTMRLRSPRLGQEVGQWFASEPVGLLSDRDIRQLQLLGLDLSATPVGEVANFLPITLSPSDSAWQAYQHMQQYRTDALAVEDCQGKHIGTVERDRLLQVARWERDRWKGGGGERRQNEQLTMKNFSLPQPSVPSSQSSEDLHTLTKEELIAELQICREQWQGEQYLHHTAAQLLQQIETDWEHTKDRFQAVLDAVPGYISWIEAIAPEVEASPPELVYLGVNQRLADVFQLVPEDFVGQSIGFLSANHEFVRYVREFFASPVESSSLEATVQAADGTTQIYLFVAQKYANQNAAVFIGIDITERKWMEEALSRSASTNRALLDALPDLMYRIHRDGTYLNYKAHKDSDLPVPPQEFLHRNVREVLPPDIAQQTLACIERSLTTKELQHLEYQLPRHGTPCYWEARFVVSGEDEVMAIVRDVTERHEAEAALRESEERFRQMAEAVSQVFWMTDPNKQQMIYVSPAYEELWGRSCASLYEVPLSFFDGIHPEDRQRVIATMGKQVKGEYDEEYRVVSPDGRERWVRDRAFPIREKCAFCQDENVGEVYRVVGVVEDITEYKRAQQEILSALEKEKELSELKSRFITMTSHEFRTPLTTILGSMELLKHYSHRWSEEKKELHFHRVHAAVKRMTQMLDDVLTLGRAESGRLGFNPTPSNIIQFCQSLVEELKLGQGREHIITFTHAEVSQEVRFDEKLLRHILSNLLSNAVKYSPKGSTITFHVTCEADKIIFRIQDAGIGIPLEDQKTLFDSFQRGKNVGNIPGTGLGLAIVKRSVDLHGGRIALHSEVGMGTEFTVMIPTDEKGRASYESY